MTLPNSNLTVRYSTRFYRFVENGQNAIRPDQEIIPTWEDYKAAADPVLDWALGKIANANGSINPAAIRRLHQLPGRRK